jgi:hypothetical protein
VTTNPPTSNSNKAYVDTTILTDVLLKPGTQECTDAQRALRQFAISELPTYAIKEFKRGPLKNYVWFHNKLALNNSLAKAMSALQRMSLTPKRYTTATALQAIVQGTLSLSRLNLGQLQTKYGSQANPDEFLCDQYRLALKVLILDAWKKRRQVTTHVVDPLNCYNEQSPFEENKLLIVEPYRCTAKTECSLAYGLKQRLNDLQKLKTANDAQGSSPETNRRSRALREIIRKPKAPVTDRTCSDLGDAIFAFFAPSGAVILTTNVRHHSPLAAALGKQVQTP